MIRCENCEDSNIKGLEVASILNFAAMHTELDRYLPEFEYQKESSRDWLWNIVNTFIHQEFQEYIQDKVGKRESELIKAKNLKVWVTPEITEVIKRSKAVSTSKGKSHFVLRPVINWKSRKQQKLEREKEEANSRYLDELQVKLEEMKSTIREYEEVS